MEKQSGRWRKYSTVVGTREDSSTSSSGKDTAANTTPGSLLPKSLHQNSQWSSIANTPVLEGWRAAITVGTNNGPLTGLSNR